MTPLDTLYKGNMFDVETSGLGISKHRMTSFAVLRYEIDRKTHKPEMKDWLHTTINGTHPQRYDDIETMKWRAKHDVNAMERAVRFQAPFPGAALDYMCSFVDHGYSLGHTAQMAKHTEFDFGFLKTYMDDCNIRTPWNYWDVCCLASLKKILPYDREWWREFAQRVLREMENELHMPCTGKKQHDALCDCWIQVNELAVVLQACNGR